jgi:hypothetical protein
MTAINLDLDGILRTADDGTLRRPGVRDLLRQAAVDLVTAQVL